jgi:hypothetical protein
MVDCTLVCFAASFATPTFLKHPPRQYLSDSKDFLKKSEKAESGGGSPRFGVREGRCSPRYESHQLNRQPDFVRRFRL